jgi:hypothetical protein
MCNPDSPDPMSFRCEFTWALVDANEEDRAVGNTHRCRWRGQHTVHQCGCGARPDD